MILARVDCGVQMDVRLTLAALQVTLGRQVWLVIKPAPVISCGADV
jgi:hypothetical protein